jgi:glutathione S-transferase
MKLYYCPGTCSLAVHIALREVGAEFDTVKVDLRTHTLPDGSDYRAVSPRGYVPLLELDDGSRHTEVAALLQWIADREPGQRLIGAPGSERRLAVIEELAFVASELHKTFSPWLFMGKDAAESTRRSVIDKLATRFAELDARLAANQWIAGGEFSVADAYAFAIIRWADGVNVPLAPYPALRAYLERVAVRPRVRETLAAEG